MDNDLPDDKNPAYLFQITDSDLLLQIIHGIIDPVELAREQLAGRGLDENGKWVGFEKARMIHGVR